MPKVDDETLRKRFLKAKEAWDERQKTNRARQRREKAEADARRRNLIGDMVLARVQDNPHERERLIKSLDAHLTDPSDRALFDLDTSPEASAHSASEDHSSLVNPANT